MNEYTKDGIHLIRRASELANEPAASRDRIKDSILFFSIGIEKLAKGALFDINPIFVYESRDFDNIAAVLYASRFARGAKGQLNSKAPGKKAIDQKVTTGIASFSMASKFVEAIESNMGMLEELFKVRGIIAHRTDPEFDEGKHGTFLKGYFYPFLSALNSELKIQNISAYFVGTSEGLWKHWAETIAAEEEVEKKAKELRAKHSAIWKARENDKPSYDMAWERTRRILDAIRDREPYTIGVSCPVCEQQAVLFYTEEFDFIAGESVLSAEHVAGFECYYCELRIDEGDYELSDAFGLRDLLGGLGL